MEKEKIETINKYLLGVKTGDRICLELLYKELASTIRFIALRYLQDDHDADDLVQDFWLDIYKTVKGFVCLQNGFNFLCKAMTRRAINRYKKLKNERINCVEFVDYGIVDQERIGDIDLMNIRAKVDIAFAILTENEKVIIQLTYFEEKTIREIAKEMGVSKSQIGKLKLIALDKMKKQLDKTSGQK